MRYRLSTLVIWTAVGPPLLLVAYLYAGFIALFVHSIPIAAAVLAVLYVPLFAFLYFRRSHWRRHRQTGVRRQPAGR